LRLVDRLKTALDSIAENGYHSAMRFLTPLVLISLVIVSVGCNNCGTAKPSNPFAQPLQASAGQTVPPPGTFSSQGIYLGQTPGSYIPQIPAATFPSTATPSPTQPTVPPTDNPLFDATDTSDGAKVFSSASAATTEKETSWTPVDMATTSHTAFQAMDAKVNSSVSYENGIAKTVSGVSDTLIVGSSPIVTAITDGSQPEASLAEPQLIYSGKYGE
jgi:hypothetical protein